MTTIKELRDTTDLPVVIANQNGLITYINARFEKTFHWTASELIGKSLTTIIPEKLHDAHNLGFSRFIKTNKPTLLNRKLTLKLLTGDGTEVETEHFIIAEKEDDIWIFGAIISPLKAATNE